MVMSFNTSTVGLIERVSQCVDERDAYGETKREREDASATNLGFDLDFRNVLYDGLHRVVHDVTITSILFCR